MKHKTFFAAIKTVSIAIIFAILVFSCSDQYDQLSENQLLADGNKVLFKFPATTNLTSNVMSISDTLWIMVSLESDSIIKDEISGRLINLRNPLFMCQLNIQDRIAPNDTVGLKLFTKNGTLKTTAKNNYLFSYSRGANGTKLKVGFLFSEIGRYAIWFNNYPNPYLAEKQMYSSNIKDGFSYDVYQNYDKESNTFGDSGYVDYFFSTILNTDGDISSYLSSSIYPESVLTIRVK